jgi:hypothetical protein
LTWLENNNFGTIGTNIFEDFQPLNPDNCITVRDVSSPAIIESSSLSVDLFAIQIIVRNTVTSTAKAILKNIHKKFMGFGGNALKSGGDIVSMVFVDQAPFSLGKDNKNRSEYEVIYNMRVESINNTYRL